MLALFMEIKNQHGCDDAGQATFSDLCDHHIEIVSPAAMPTMKPLL